MITLSRTLFFLHFIQKSEHNGLNKYLLPSSLNLWALRIFWQQNNRPIELWSAGVVDQKVDYIHHYPVEAGFVNEPRHWRYSSTIDYSGGKGILEIDFIYN